MPHLSNLKFVLAAQQCEDLEDEESLKHMYYIVRGAIMLNDAGLMETFLAEENVMDTVRHCLHALVLRRLKIRHICGCASRGGACSNCVHVT